MTKSFRELGLDIDEFKEAARPCTLREDGPIGRGGRKIEQVGHIEGRFKDWYMSLPPEDRARTSIGKTRGALLASGAIQWDDMIDFATGQIRTLASMGYSRSSKKGVPAVGQVKDYDDLCNEIKTRCNGLATNNGIKAVEIVRGESYFMQTDSAGHIWINEDAFTDCKDFSAAKDLKAAWNKIAANGKDKLTFNEEYAIESLWHELVHNRQTKTKAGKEGSIERRMMETVTQWVARRTYPRLLEALSKNAVKAEHQADILERGHGYLLEVRNFGRLMERLGVKDDQKALRYFKEVCRTEDRDKYQAAIEKYLLRYTKRTVKPSDISRALEENSSEEKDYDDFLDALIGK